MRGPASIWEREIGPLRRSTVVLILRLVVAGLAAGRTIEKAILAEADIDLRLAEAAVLLAFAALFAHLALHAAVLGFGGGCLCG